MNDKVSIVVPYFNNENHIQETLQSIYEQTHKNIEVIIVDDGSENESASFLDSLKQDFNNLTVLHKKNEGQSLARNDGAKLATGHYLLFLDADDIIHNTFLQKCLHVLNTDKSVGLVYTKAEYFGSKNGEWILPEYSLKRMLFENSIPIFALMYRSDFNKTGGFDKELSFFEDWDLWLALIKNGIGVHRIDEILFYYRQRQEVNSLSDKIKSNREEISHNIYCIYKKHYQFYIQNGILFLDFFRASAESFRYKKKYYNIWYKKLFYNLKSIFSKKKEIEISEFEKIMIDAQY